MVHGKGARPCLSSISFFFILALLLVVLACVALSKRKMGVWSYTGLVVVVLSI